LENIINVRTFANYEEENDQQKQRNYKTSEYD